jgi:hypothetical protein
MPLNYVVTGMQALGALGSLGGLFGAGAARKRAIAARDAALRDISLAWDEELATTRANNARSLMSFAGEGASALEAQGRSLGSALAGAGVYNSSAAAGALTQAARDRNAALLELAARNRATEAGIASRGRQELGRLRLGFAGEDIARADARQAAGFSGLQSFLGALNQYNQARMGTPNAREFGNNAGNGMQNASPVLPSVLGAKPVMDFSPANRPYGLDLPNWDYGIPKKLTLMGGPTPRLFGAR